MNLDGYALPIKKLKGTEPVESLDLSHKLGCGDLGVASAVVIASLIHGNASLTSLNLLSNKLDVESAGMLLKIKAEKLTLRTLCGLTHEETELNFFAQPRPRARRRNASCT